jgi:hypothetical protein
VLSEDSPNGNADSSPARLPHFIATPEKRDSRELAFRGPATFRQEDLSTVRGYPLLMVLMVEGDA